MLLPFLLQGIAMGFDEFLFHRKRGLPQWEAYGHPLDTLSVFICYGFLILSRETDGVVITYAILSLISCLIITKDEWIHQKVCSPAEHWLHSLLFILHPVTLFLAGWMWSHPQEFTEVLILLKLLATLTFFFMLYQFYYWRTRWNPATPQSPKSITQSTMT